MTRLEKVRTGGLLNGTLFVTYACLTILLLAQGCGESGRPDERASAVREQSNDTVRTMDIGAGDFIAADDIERLIGGAARPWQSGRTGYYGLGREPIAEEIAGWDIDILADGMGLPPGSGSVADGETLYEQKCSICHGTFGEGTGRWPPLASGTESLTAISPERTVGNYWQYAPTVWDYIRRAMPFYEPQSLAPDDVYALTAYLFYLNDLVDYDLVLSEKNLPEIQLPNRDGFVMDSRPDTANIVCMTKCNDPATIRITSEVAR